MSVFSFQRFSVSAFSPAGDPTVLGWATFALYLLASACSFRAALALRSAEPGSEPARVWRALAVILLLLGLNKQLDLQTALTKLGQQLTVSSDLYASRRVIQLIFLVGLLLILGWAAARYSKALQNFARQYPLAGTGSALVVIYVVLRAVSIEHVDRLLGFDLEGATALGLMELLGTILVIAEYSKTPKR